MDAEAAINPTLLVEVLSDSSEAYDRGEKFAHYRRLAALKEYLIVSPREARLELFRRTSAGTWELREAGPGGRVTLDSLGVELSTDEVFESPLAS
jgi:Uma2 family endonuclease